MTDAFDELVDVAGSADRELLDSIIELIRIADSDKPRSLQLDLGPSEVGHPCQRKLAYLMTRERGGFRGHNHFADPLPAIVGTAMHTWLEEALRAANRRLGRTRWIPEQRLQIRDAQGDYNGLYGTCDFYDLDTASVLDWKVRGKSAFEHTIRHGPQRASRGQVACYGYGYERLGLPVKYVGIVTIPRAGSLRKTDLWRTDYDRTEAERVFARIDATRALIQALDLPNRRENFRVIPIEPGDDCRLCPFWSPAPDPTDPLQCGGPNEPRTT